MEEEKKKSKSHVTGDSTYISGSHEITLTEVREATDEAHTLASSSTKYVDSVYPHGEYIGIYSIN